MKFSSVFCAISVCVYIASGIVECRAQSQSLCVDEDPDISNIVVLKQINVRKNYLALCGNMEARKRMTGLQNFFVVYQNPKKTYKLFESDDAFKIYSIADIKNGFSIQEKIVESTAEGPIIGIQISCDDQACNKSEVCVWKKKESKRNLKNPKPSDLIFAALDGNKEAQDYFKGKNRRFDKSWKGDTSAQEEIATYRQDFQRLTKAHCLK